MVSFVRYLGKVGYVVACSRVVVLICVRRVRIFFVLVLGVEDGR